MQNGCQLWRKCVITYYQANRVGRAAKLLTIVIFLSKKSCKGDAGMPNDLPTYTTWKLRTVAIIRSCFYLDFMNKRLRVDDYLGNVHAIYVRIAEIAKSYALTKVFIKSREDDWQFF